MHVTIVGMNTAQARTVQGSLENEEEGSESEGQCMVMPASTGGDQSKISKLAGRWAPAAGNETPAARLVRLI